MSRFSAETIFKGVDKTSAVVRKIEQNASSAAQRIGASFKKLDAQFSGMTSGMNKAGLAVGAGALAAGAGLAVLSQTGMEFEHVMASLAAVAKPTATELDKLQSKALEVGSSMGFSGIEVARAMEAMSKQGLGVQEVIAGIGGVAAAAAADGSTIEETMGGLLATMTGLGKGAGELQRIADVMAKAGDTTAASIGSLSDSMSVFAPVARQLNIPLESAIGQLAILQDAGIDAGSAGTTLAAVYSKLAAPVKRTRDALAELGVTVADEFDNMKAPQVLMNEMLAATSKIKGNVGKAAAITELVGLESQKALSNIIGSVESGKFDKVMASLSTGVDGYADAIARAKLDSTTGDMMKLNASFEAFKITIFGLVSRDLRDLVKGMTDWTMANKEWLASGIKDGIAALKDNLPTIVKWLGRIGKVVATVYAMSFAIKAVSVALAIASAIAKASPLFLWVYAITAAIALLWAFWPEISAFFTGLWETIKSIVGKIGEFLLAAFELWLGVGVLIWGPIIQGAIDLWNAIVSWLSPLFPFFQGLWASVSSGFSVAWESIKAVASTVWDTLTGLFAPLAEWFGSLWASIAAGFQSTFGAVLDKISWAVGAVRSLGQAALGTGDEGGAQTPGERTAKSISESRASVNGTIEVKSNVPAKVTRQPTGGVGLKVAHTGAL